MEKLVNSTLSAENSSIQNGFPKVVPQPDLLDIIPSMVASFDNNFKIEYANRAFLKHFQTTNESLNQKAFADVVGQQIFTQINVFLPAVLLGKTAEFDVDLHSKDRLNALQIHLAPAQGHDGSIRFLFHATDVGSKFRAEREIKDCLENVVIGIHWVNRDGIIIWANLAELKMLGYEEDEYVGHHISEFHADENTINEILHRVVNGETLRNFEARLKCKDGSIRFVSISSNAMWENGKFIRTTCFTEDITEQKHLFESLKKEERKYRALLDTLPAAIYTCDREGRITYFNDVAASLWGHRPALNSDSQKFCAAYKVWLNGKFIPSNETPMAIAINEGRSFRNLEPVFEKPDGTSFNAHVTIDPVYDGAGNIAGAINVFQDVTPLKKMEQALGKSERQYNRLLKVLPAGVYSCDKEGRITYYNDVSAQLWGYTPELNSDLVKFCAPCKVWMEDGTLVAPGETPMAIAVKTGQSFRNVEVLIERPDGLRFNASVSIEPIFDEENNLTGTINVLQDITRIKQVELALRESELHHKQVLELLPAAVYTCDVEGKIKLFNKAAADLWGREPEVGKDMWCGSWKIFDPESYAPVPLDTCPMAVALKEGTPVYGAEILVERPDGLRRNVAPNPRPIFDSKGNKIGAVNMLLDITEQKMAARAIKESEARFRMMADLVPIVIWLSDQNGEFTYMNPPWSELTGQELKSGLGRGWFNFVHVMDRDLVEKTLNQAVQHKTTFDVKFRYQIASSSYSIYHSYGKPRYDDMGQYLGHIGVMQDISRQEELKSTLEDEVRSRTEELREKNIVLENVNRELASFAYVSSHDLQEPLRKIQTLTSRILELDRNNLSAKSKDYFERITSASKRMRALIEDLLAYSRANSSERKFEVKNLNELVQEAYKELKESIDEKQAIVEIGTLPAIPIIPFQFLQLTLNILSNALKFSKTGVRPHITVKAAVVQGASVKDLQGVDLKKEYHQISFKDNGIGFAPEYRTKIFQVFQRLHSRSEYSGTGVGLAICKKIVENHNGMITAESIPDGGATFHVYIPV